MPHQIRGEEATALLRETFALAEEDHRSGAAVGLSKNVVADIELLFTTKVQAYRQALLGCAIARVLDERIDIRYPATERNDDSFSGRSLDEGVVMPFLREKAVPMPDSSVYLSALRGGARLIPGGEPRIQKYQKGYDTLVAAVDHLRGLDEQAARSYLRCLLRRFVVLRESAKIPLTRLANPKLEQLERLIDGLLTVPSGGRIPAYLATGMFQTISDCHKLSWVVEFQGINAADKASGAVGDITIKNGGSIILGIEVTERAVTAARVKTTFDQKVAPAKLRDYLFVTTTKADSAAMEMARNYTAAGHEINFVDLKGWLIDNLASVGPDCRAIFQDKVIVLLADAGTPAALRVAWNEKMDAAIGVRPG